MPHSGILYQPSLGSAISRSAPQANFHSEQRGKSTPDLVKKARRFSRGESASSFTRLHSVRALSQNRAIFHFADLSLTRKLPLLLILAKRLRQKFSSYEADSAVDTPDLSPCDGHDSQSGSIRIIDPPRNSLSFSQNASPRLACLITYPFPSWNHQGNPLAKSPETRPLYKRA